MSFWQFLPEVSCWVTSPSPSTFFLQTILVSSLCWRYLLFFFVILSKANSLVGSLFVFCFDSLDFSPSFISFLLSLFSVLQWICMHLFLFTLSYILPEDSCWISILSPSISFYFHLSLLMYTPFWSWFHFSCIFFFFLLLF